MSKILKGEAKAQATALSVSVKELARLQKVQKQAAAVSVLFSVQAIPNLTASGRQIYSCETMNANMNAALHFHRRIASLGRG